MHRFASSPARAPTPPVGLLHRGFKDFSVTELEMLKTRIEAHLRDPAHLTPWQAELVSRFVLARDKET